MVKRDIGRHWEVAQETADLKEMLTTEGIDWRATLVERPAGMAEEVYAHLCAVVADMAVSIENRAESASERQFFLNRSGAAMERERNTYFAGVSAAMRRMRDVGMPVRGLSLLNGAAGLHAGLRAALGPNQSDLSLHAVKMSTYDGARLALSDSGFALPEGLRDPEELIFLVDDVVDNAVSLLRVAAARFEAAGDEWHLTETYTLIDEIRQAINPEVRRQAFGKVLRLLESAGVVFAPLISKNPWVNYREHLNGRREDLNPAWREAQAMIRPPIDIPQDVWLLGGAGESDIPLLDGSLTGSRLNRALRATNPQLLKDPAVRQTLEAMGGAKLRAGGGIRGLVGYTGGVENYDAIMAPIFAQAVYRNR
jgi:hypothetical protein